MSLIVVWKKRSDTKPYYTDNLKNHVYPSHARVKPVKMYILSLLFLSCFLLFILKPNRLIVNIFAPYWYSPVPHCVVLNICTACFFFIICIFYFMYCINVIVIIALICPYFSLYFLISHWFKTVRVLYTP